MTAKDTFKRLKNQEREARRKVIIDAARSVFGSKPYDRTSMQGIADQAGIAKSSIYNYFASQEALYVEVAFQDSNRLIDTLEKSLVDESETGIGGVVNQFIDYCTRNESFWRMITLFALYGKLGSQSSRRMDVVARRLMDHLDRIFESNGAGEDRQRLSHALFASISGILVA
ncbi:MAG: TetR/AcrR family transcriptional regulator, partial [Desulfobacterales bacterium]